MGSREKTDIIYVFIMNWLQGHIIHLKHLTGTAKENTGPCLFIDTPTIQNTAKLKSSTEDLYITSTSKCSFCVTFLG